MIFFEGNLTQASECRDFVEWHLGRAPYLFWALDLDMPAVRQRIDRAATHLSGLLLDVYRRQPHLTLDVCGFPSAQPHHADDFASQLLLAQFEALRASRLPCFEIDIGALASFPSAPYLKVGDGGNCLAAIRQCLAVEGASRLTGDYTPHVTVGLYADAWPAAVVHSRLAGFAAGEPLSCRIEQISLMSYAPSEIGGALSRLGSFHLDEGAMRWHDAADRLIPEFWAALRPTA